MMVFIPRSPHHDCKGLASPPFHQLDKIQVQQEGELFWQKGLCLKQIGLRRTPNEINGKRGRNEATRNRNHG